MSRRQLIAGVIGIGIVFALVARVFIDRHELARLKTSHEVREHFCSVYRGQIQDLGKAFRSDSASVRMATERTFYALVQPAFFELCRVDARQLDDGLHHLTDCTVTLDDRDYSCMLRVVDKLVTLIPETFDP